MAMIHVSKVIERLERSLVESTESTCNGKTEKVISDMRIIQDFMRKQKLGRRSRLDYFISDIVDMVHEALNVKDDLTVSAKLSPLERWVCEVKIRLLKFGIPAAESAGVEGDDHDQAVVGLETYINLLFCSAIFSEEKGLQTLTISGIPSIGKTTLARQIYNHADVRDRFDVRVWVRVSSELSHKEVLVKLIKQVVHPEELERDSSLLRKFEYGDNRNLRQILHQRLDGMRYFIVLDDWPEQMCLRYILKALPHQDKGSRLLLTNRTPCIEENIYYDCEMSCLDYASSWELFLKTILSGKKEQKFPKQLEKKGREMLRKCWGLPSAIKDVGRKLAEKRESGSEWEDIVEFWQCMSNHDMVATNISKALILWMIQKLERSPYSGSGQIQELINELCIIFQEIKSGYRRSLNYFTCDIVDMAREALSLYVKGTKLSVYDDKVSSLTRSVVEVKLQMFKLGADDAEMQRSSQGHDDDEHVVGLEEDVESLLRRAFLNEEKSLKTYTVTGMVGIGKTTLARQVYNHPEVVSRFECCAWVCVSADLSYKQLLMRLIQEVVDYEEPQIDLLLNKMEYEDNPSLKQMLHQQLQGKRYFIVLDNWQQQMCLEYIFTCIPHEDKGSRLLLTSRTYCREYYNHEVIPLDAVSSWQLFLKTISSGNENKFPKQLEVKGREILNIQCCGLPLAIKDVGSQLAEKRASGSEWEDLVELWQCMPVATNMAKAIILWVIGKLEMSMASEWEDFLELWQSMSNLDIVTTNMAKALTSWRIRKLERQMGEIPASWNGKLEKVVNELRTILNLLEEKKLGSWSRLNYFIHDIVEMVREALSDYLGVRDEISFLERRLVEVKMRMSKVRSENEVVVEQELDDDGDVVGLETDVKVLSGRAILNMEKRHQTSTITGMIGIGKTTLARHIYNHGAIIRHFDCRAWVCVPSDFTYRELLIKLIQQVIDRDSLLKIEYANNLSLKEMLCRHLQGRRYFIIFDDWTEEMCLRSIINGLPNEENGSRLLLAGRSDFVEAQTYIHYRHKMRYLDTTKSWKLFSKTIFSGNKLKGENQFPNEFKSMARQLLAECGGLPLAIKYVGRQLAEKRQAGSEWEEILKSVDFGPILDLLEPVYQKLDRPAKSCFWHLALFKQNTTVRVEKLMILIWAAGGMASEEEITKSLHQMVKQSTIEVEDFPIKRFCVNPLLHKLSTKKAMEEIGFEMARNNNVTNRSSQSPRHRAIFCSRDSFVYSDNHDKLLVSLFFRGGGHLDASPSYWKNFEQLKILDLEDFGIKMLPESIGTLVELIYLGLRNNYMQELPHSLGCLKKLEVLDIALNCMVDVPDIIWEMSSLRCLYMTNIIFREPLFLFVLGLESLTYVSAENWTCADWWPLTTKLRKLGIEIEEVDGDSNIGGILVALSKMKELNYLSLRGSRFKSMPTLVGFPSCLVTLKLDGRLASVTNMPSNISSLKLVNSCLVDDPMPLLGKLPKIEYLKLRNAYTGRKMEILPYGFPELKVLHIEESWNLRDVKIGNGAMQGLQKLQIKNCPYLENLPREIRWMPNLEELKMVTTKKIAMKIMKSDLNYKIKVVEMLELNLPREFNIQS